MSRAQFRSEGVAVVAILALIACHTPSEPRCPEAAVLRTRASASAPPPVEARWILWPRWNWRAAAQLTTSAGELYVGEDGQRWLVGAAGPSSAGPAPDALTGVLRAEPGFLFISQSGRVFGSDTPLGPLVEYPNAAAQKAVSGRDHFVVLRDGELYVSSNGSEWRRSRTPEHGGIADLVLSGTGSGLALSRAGALFETRSDGLEFRALAAPRRIVRLDRRQNTLLAIVETLGAERARYFEIEGASLSELREGPVTAEFPLKPFGVSPERVSLSSAGRWLAVREQPSGVDSSSTWEVSIAGFGERPSYRHLPELDDHCFLLAEPFAGLSFVAECGPESARALHLFRSSQGDEFVDLPLRDLSAKDFAQARVVHSVGGGAFVLAVPCGTRGGPRLLKPPALDAMPLGEAPCLEHQAFSRDETETLSVAQSNAGFTLHRWAKLRPELLRALPPPLLRPDPRLVDAGASRPAARAVAVTRDESGTVVVVLDTGTSDALFRSDGGGPFQQVALPGDARQRVRVAGRRALSLDGLGRGYETNDAGRSWHRVVVPASFRGEDLDCIAAGCAARAGFRVGWALP
jgi:hypothetical protein